MTAHAGWACYGAVGRGRWAARARWPLRKAAALLRVRRACRNWVRFAAFRCRLLGKVEVELRSGAVVSLAGRSDLPSAFNSEEWNLCLLGVYCGPLEVQGDQLRFHYRGRPLTVRRGEVREYHSLLREQFVDEQYRWLDVRGRDVLDVGGSIGDSAIYFALNGARRVLVLEPYPASFRILQANVAANHLEASVTALLAGAGRDGLIQVSADVASGSAAMRASEGGASVPTCSLRTLLAQGEWRDAAAKIDCEGGEYSLLMDASVHDLRQFERYFIEFHQGLQDLGRKLAGAGFDVWYTAAEADTDAISGEPCQVGLVRARRRG